MTGRESRPQPSLRAAMAVSGGDGETRPQRGRGAPDEAGMPDERFGSSLERVDVGHDLDRVPVRGPGPRGTYEDGREARTSHAARSAKNTASPSLTSCARRRSQALSWREVVPKYTSPKTTISGRTKRTL